MDKERQERVHMREAIYNNFIKDERWRYLTDGLQVTLEVTFFSVLIGIVIGFLVAVSPLSYDKTGKLKLLNAICKVYLTVIRGTPVVIQLMIFYYCIFVSRVFAGVFVGVIAFGLNSAAYVARSSVPVSCRSRGTDGGRSKPWF